VAALQADKDNLTRIYGAISTRPLPAEWLRLIETRVAQRRPFAFSQLFARNAAALALAGVLLIIGLGLAYERFTFQKDDSILAEALAARSETMHAEQSFAANEFARPETVNQLLTAALGMMLKAPDLGRIGYSLADIRLYSGVSGGTSVKLDYRDAKNRLFTLYLRHPSGPTRIDLLEREGIRICIWQDDVLGTVMLGEMSAGEMARAAGLAYAGLNS
jgi:anti-sigma factor RsiW